ncbi:MAG: adenylate kinase [Candidatus Neomarinimicrobiota bacterium]
MADSHNCGYVALIAERKMRLVLLGPPGIGKGTQAGILAGEYGILHLSTGDILRSEIDRKTALGILAKPYIDKGRLVPDETMLDLMTRRLEQKDVLDGYILDGFPRTLPQGTGLQQILGKLSQELTSVLALEGDMETIVERLSGRRTCRNCGTIAHVIHHPPKIDGVCDRCGGELYQRDDDRPDVIRERIEVYQRQTEPLMEYYSKNSLLKKISGKGTVEEITDNIIRVIPK